VPFILRQIRKSRWYKEDWGHLEGEDIPADPLGDLVTTGNELSVWFVKDDRSNLDQVVTALAANRDNISTFDYTLFDLKVLEDLGISSKKTSGGTLDELANNSWHIDLAGLTAFKLVKLAKMLLDKGERKRVLGKEIRRLIANAVASEQIELAKLKPSLKDKVESLITSDTSQE
jgi:hypothetical protein